MPGFEYAGNANAPRHHRPLGAMLYLEETIFISFNTHRR